MTTILPERLSPEPLDLEATLQALINQYGLHAVGNALVQRYGMTAVLGALIAPS